MKRFGLLACGLLLAGTVGAQTLTDLQVNTLSSQTALHGMRSMDLQPMSTSDLLGDTLDSYLENIGTCSLLPGIKLTLQTGPTDNWLGGPFVDFSPFVGQPAYVREQGLKIALTPPPNSDVEAARILGVFIPFDEASVVNGDPDEFKVKVYNSPSSPAFVLFGEQTFQAPSPIPALPEPTNFFLEEYFVEFGAFPTLEGPSGPYPDSILVTLENWGPTFDDTLKFWWAGNQPPDAACAPCNWYHFAYVPGLGGGNFFLYDQFLGGINFASPLFFPVIEWDYTTGAKEKTIVNAFSVYPNPASGVATIETRVKIASSKVDILDLSGRTVRSADLTFNGNQANLDVTGLVSGVYTLRVSSSAGNEYLKLNIR